MSFLRAAVRSAATRRVCASSPGCILQCRGVHALQKHQARRAQSSAAPSASAGSSEKRAVHDPLSMTIFGVNSGAELVLLYEVPAVCCTRGRDQRVRMRFSVASC